MIEFEGYHGTSLQASRKILEEMRFKPSEDEDSLRMGRGVYFFSKETTLSFAQECAAAYCKAKFRKAELGVDTYAVLKCVVSCENEELLDLFIPSVLESFHTMRYAEYDRLCKACPGYELRDASELDTAVINRLRRIQKIAVVRAPQYFSPLTNEEAIRVAGKHPYRKTYLPNVLMICADPDLVTIRNIEVVERGKLRNDGYAGTVG